MRREGSHLVPVDAVAAEMLAEVPMNTGVMVTVKVPRNLRQFRLAWALADIVSKSVDFLHDREDAMTWLKIKARHVRMLQDPLRGTVAIVPKSIAFASLDQAGFARVLNRMIYVTTTEIIPGLQESSLRAELETIVGIDSKPANAPEPEKPPKATRTRKTAPEPLQGQEPASGTAGNANPAAPSASPSEDTRPAGAPTNEAEYLIAARKWIAKQTDHGIALEYLDSEQQIALRAKCKLSIGANKMIRRELAEHCEEQQRKPDAKTQD